MSPERKPYMEFRVFKDVVNTHGSKHAVEVTVVAIMDGEMVTNMTESGTEDQIKASLEDHIGNFIQEMADFKLPIIKEEIDLETMYTIDEEDTREEFQPDPNSISFDITVFRLRHPPKIKDGSRKKGNKTFEANVSVYLFGKLVETRKLEEPSTFTIKQRIREYKRSVMDRITLNPETVRVQGEETY